MCDLARSNVNGDSSVHRINLSLSRQDKKLESSCFFLFSCCDAFDAVYWETSQRNTSGVQILWLPNWSTMLSCPDVFQSFVLDITKLFINVALIFNFWKKVTFVKKGCKLRKRTRGRVCMFCVWLAWRLSSVFWRGQAFQHFVQNLLKKARTVGFISIPDVWMGHPSSIIAPCRLYIFAVFF